MRSVFAALEGDAIWEAIWNIPNFFIGVAQVFTDAVTNLYSLIPNPDPFPGMIDGMNGGNYELVQTVSWWLDTAYDMMFIRDMLAGWFEMWIVAVAIFFIWKIINKVAG